MAEPTREQLLSSLTDYRDFTEKYPHHPPTGGSGQAPVMSAEGYELYRDKMLSEDDPSGGYISLGPGAAEGGPGPSYKFYGPDSRETYKTGGEDTQFLSSELLPKHPSLWENMSAPVYQKQDYSGTVDSYGYGTGSDWGVEEYGSPNEKYVFSGRNIPTVGGLSHVADIGSGADDAYGISGFSPSATGRSAYGMMGLERPEGERVYYHTAPNVVTHDAGETDEGPPYYYGN